MKTIIITDSCCDLPLKFFKERKAYIEVVGMPIIMNDVEYVDDMGESFTHEFFYKQLRSGVMPSTSQINVLTFKETFERLLAQNRDIIYLGFTSGMSGTYNNAQLAKSMLEDEGIQGKITLIDSLSASAGLGALLIHVVKLVERGASYDEIVSWTESNKENTHHWFAVDDLMHLKKGGRIPATTAVVGTMLNVKPILVLDENGKLKNFASVRGQKKAMRYLVDKALLHLTDAQETEIVIAHADAEEEANKMEAMIKEHRTKDTIVVTELSATIATHVGPGMVAVAFVANTRREF